MSGKKQYLEIDFIQSQFETFETKQTKNVRSIEIFSSGWNKNGNDIKYSCYIPDDLYNACKDLLEINSIPKSKLIEDVLVSNIKTKLNILIKNVLSELKNKMYDSKSKKYIVIRFDSTTNKTKDQLNFSYTGEKTTINFSYFIVYDGNGFNNKDCYYTKERLDNNGLISKKSYIRKDMCKCVIEWTQERENFLNEIENNFKKLSENLNKFLGDLDVNKLDNLIENKINYLSFNNKNE